MTAVPDLKWAVRAFARTPGFTAVAVLTLGLGIGATTAIFSVVHGVLMKPLPYRDSGRLANIWVDLGVGNQSLPAVSPGDFRDYQQRSRLFESFAAATGAQLAGVNGALRAADGSETERVDVTPVSANFFTLMGADPILGRHFLPEEETPGGAQVAILSHSFWKRHYGSDPTIVGRQIRLDGLDHTVVGVLPETFSLLLPVEAFLVTDAEIWKPLKFDYRQAPPRNFTFFTVFGRLKPGVTFDQAQAEMDGIARQLRQEHAEHESSDMRIRVVPLQDDIVKHARPALLALVGAVAFVLLIACANVAHLLLARSTARQHEMALRAALGARGLRLVRQLVTESLVLAAAGGLVGLVLAEGGLVILRAIDPANLPRMAEIRIDGAVLAFTLAVTAVTAIVFGTVPALRTARPDLNRTLRASTSLSPTPTQLRLRNALVVAEVALALILLIGAGLMMRSFVRLQQVRPGFDHEQTLTFRVALPRAVRPRPDDRRAFVDEMERRLLALPGVTAVGLTSQLPLTGSGPLQPYAYDEATARNWESATSDRRLVSPDYFKAIGTRVLAGRVFDTHDRDTPSLIVIDETLAARAWPGQPAVGKRLQVNPTGSDGDLYAEVIGVVEHMRILDLTQAVRPQIWGQMLGVGGTFLRCCPHRPRPVAVGPGGPAADGGARQGSGGRPSRADVGVCGRWSGSGASQPRVDVRVRRRSARARRRRRLRRDLVFGWTADAGDRHSHGARRESRARQERDPGPGPAAHRPQPLHRRRRSVAPIAFHQRAAVRDPRRRSTDIRRDGRVASRGRAWQVAICRRGARRQ